MKVATILGTRPEIIRLSRILPLLDRLLDDGHQVLHTGQNYDPELDGDLWTEFNLRAPDVRVESGGGTFAEQLAVLLPAVEGWLNRFHPDRFLVLGDTNSSLGALVAARTGIPVYHLEAGNRCRGSESPEEVNRRVIDHVSAVHLCYTERARMNLLAEGLPLARTFVVGNPLSEVLAEQFYPAGYPEKWQHGSCEPWRRHGLEDRGFLATLHRAENVDDQERLIAFLGAIHGLCVEMDARCLLSTHPRTRACLAGREVTWDRILFSDPLPFCEFVALEVTSRLVLSDSGTAPEECSILGRPLVVLRDYMERQEILECGGCTLWSPGSPVPLPVVVRAVLDGGATPRPPPGHDQRPVAATVARILLSPLPPV